MRWFYFYLLIIFLSTGCSNTSDNTLKDEAPAFTIKMAPSFAPAANTPVPVNSTLLLEVSKPLDPSTVNGTTVYLQNVTGEHIPASVVYVNSNENPNIVITPAIYFLPQTTYEIIVSTDVTTTEGTKLSQKAIIPFTSDISIDSTPPTLVTTLPLATESPEPFSIIYFQFSETLSPLLDPNLFRVYDAVNDINISGTTKFSGRLISFTPDSNLTTGKQYFVELNTSSITDLSSNAYTGPAVDFNFTVVQAINATPKATPNKTLQNLDLNSKVNCIFPLDPIVSSGTNAEIFFGTDDGLKIVSFNFDQTDFKQSTMSIKSTLTFSQVGIIYDINIDTTAKRAYLASSKGLFIINISDTSALTIINQYPTLDTNNKPVPVYGLDVANDHIYAAVTILGIYDLNITNELKITKLFTTQTNGVAFDITYDGTALFVSDYNENFKKYDLNGNLATPLTPNTLGTTHNIMSYFENYGGYPIKMSASGIRGLTYIDESDIVHPLAIAAYTSQVRRNVFNGNASFAVLKDLGLLYFTPYDSGAGSILLTKYLLLPYKVTSAGYVAYDTPISKSINFITDTKGTVHAYLFN